MRQISEKNEFRSSAICRWVVFLSLTGFSGVILGTIGWPVSTVQASRPGSSANDLTRTIDEELNAALSKAGISVSPVASDAEFLRRATLDLTGKIPSYEKTKSFLADRNPAKRPELIDELLAS